MVEELLLDEEEGIVIFFIFFNLTMQLQQIKLSMMGQMIAVVNKLNFYSIPVILYDS